MLPDTQQTLAVALEAGRQAALVHRKYLGTVASEDWSEKGVADFVTHVDHEAEARIVETITRDTYLSQFRTIIGRVSDIRRAGSAALDLCHLASGDLDAFWELDLRPGDYAAGTLVIREAGGIGRGLFDAGTRVGDPDWRSGGGIIAGNPHVYLMLQELLLSLRTVK